MAGVWDTLGIAETDDIGAVRSAYARALKRIDIDADPRAYIALREARDHAIGMIRHAAMRAAHDAAAETQILPEAAPEPATPVDIPAGTYEEHLADLNRFLLPTDESTDVPADAAVVRARFAALLADPRMDEIAFRAQAEAQLAHLIATSLPRSAILVRPAMAAFGWVGPSRIDMPPAIATILDAAHADEQEQPRVTAAPAPDGTPSPPAEGDDAQAQFFADRYNALAALLFPQQQDAQPLTPEEQRTASGLFATLLCDPRMELVTFRVGAEAQFAQMIARSIPRSDCILPRAVAFFHWEETQGRIDQADVIAHILHRERGLRFLHAVQARDHPFHAAWIELTTPLSTKRPALGAVNSGTIYTLLNSIRTEQPLLERELDGPRVSLWDEKLGKSPPPSASSGSSQSSSSGRLPVWRVVVFAFFLLVSLGRLASGLATSGTDSSPTGGIPRTLVGANTGSDGLQNATAADVDPVLAEIGGGQITLTLLETLHSPLATTLTDQWTKARDQQQDLSDFQRTAEKEVLDSIATTIRNSDDDDLVADYQRQRMIALTQLTDTAPGNCVELGRPGKVVPGDGPGFLPEQRKDVFARVLQAPSNDAAPLRPDGPALDGDTLAAIGSKINAPPGQARMLLGGWAGSYQAQCRARIAEIQTLLDLPKRKGIPLLKLL